VSQHAITGHAGAGLGGGQLQQPLALVGDEGVDMHQRLDVGLAGGGVGDDRPTVGVADQQDRAADDPKEGGAGWAG
jgi:hypothetical protein